jgi:BirA family transcriptional regulator, biotin operon repressor / biotin---[acetyl-CoA-carboxylase] ligase
MTDPDDILQRIGSEARESLELLEVFPELESTNSWLLQQAGPSRGRFHAVIAEHQTAGRGRSDKIWLSPPGSGLCLSLAYTFAELPRHLPSLTLAIGAAIATALEDLGAKDLALKWPNDLMAQDGKLGGILTELQSNGEGGRAVVVGLGLNVDLPDTMRYTPPTSWTSKVTDLAACLPGELPERAALIAAVVKSMVECIARFAREGFGHFHSVWQRYDWLKGKQWSVQQAQRRITGLADGIDEDGALLLRTNVGVERIISGSIDLSAYGAASG